MNSINTSAIVLKRINFSEADRIITLITPDHGKLKLIARGVRKIHSKLAGGVELFSISDITFIHGKNEIGTLISTRLKTHYSNIVKDLDRTMIAYELIKNLDVSTEDRTDTAYFNLLNETFAALDDSSIETSVTQLWFLMQLLRLGGHTPDLRAMSVSESVVNQMTNYSFSSENMSFTQNIKGNYTKNHIKLLRIGFSETKPRHLQQVQDIKFWLNDIAPLIQTMTKTYIRL